MEKQKKSRFYTLIFIEKVPILWFVITEKVPIICLNRLKYLFLQLNKEM